MDAPRPERANLVYVQVVGHVERLHRQLLALIGDEFTRMGWDDISAVQALLLFNIGDREVTAGEVRTSGIYLGSNASYNLKKLVEGQYLLVHRPEEDRRLVRLKLSPKGEEVVEVVDELYERQLQVIEQNAGLDRHTLSELNAGLQQLERFWADQKNWVR